MKALDIKLLRDLWHMRGQALAIALVLAAAAATFIMSESVHRSLSATRDAYYARNHFADVFAGMTRAPRVVLYRAAAIPGVRRVEGGIQQYATIDFPNRETPGATVLPPGALARHDDPVRALIQSVSEDGSDQLNRITLRRGRLPQIGRPGEAVVDEAFARANGLVIGSQLDALIYGSQERLEIVGIGLAPNYIWALGPGDLMPDDTRFGVLWMGREALEAATDRTEAINALSLTLERGAAEADVIRAVDTLLDTYGGTGAYGRVDHPSHAFLDSELMQLDAMTRVIPPIFLIVATFLVYIVLGRMIRTERAQIGLMKAFGYSDWAVGWHYLKFALAVAMLATVLGTAAGIWMGSAMTRLYAEYYRFPFLHYQISASVIPMAGSLAMAAAGLGAIGGMRAAVALTPAVAMSPPPPPIYRAGLAETLGRRAGFTAIGAMIARHILRWPGRSAITVLGVALSIGLLFSTIQFIDSSRVMLDSFFFRTQRQDLTVTFTEPRNDQAVKALARIPGVLRVEAVRAVPVRLRHGNSQERTAIESAAEDARLTARIDADGREIALPPAGLMLSRQLSDQLGAQAGAVVEVEQLGGRRTRLRLPVTGVVEEFVGARAYAGDATLAAITRDAAPVGAALLRIDSLERHRIIARLKQMPVVLGVTERSAALVKFQQMIDENILTMMAFYIAFASAIAVGVVYNSARILFSERAHELATLRVLGYHRSEVGVVLLGELALLVALAVPFGCLIGYAMANLMTAMFSSDLFRLPFAPSRASYGLAVLIVLIASLATAASVARRVMRLDMVRVLKARE
ncbi:MAG: ABC transporter permease [Novosphingobium sp.]